MKKLSIGLTMVFLFGVALMASTTPALATTWMIGDNDGYGMGIADGANHPFNGFSANYDGRSAAEKLATTGAQFTDTYSTSHPGYDGPTDQGTVSTFSFSGLGSGWTEGSMWFDMADFQASTFGPVRVTYNGIVQNWAFNDGFPNTVVRFFDLDANVVASINALGKLDVVIDRFGSGDFYGFDYAMLSNNTGANTTVPEPASMILFGAGLAGIALFRKKIKA